MKSRAALLLAAAIATTPLFAATPTIYHLGYENNGIYVAGTITTDGTIGPLTANDIIGVHLLVSTTGLPGIILEPLGPGYTTVQINSTAVTATAQGLFFDTTNPQGYLSIGDTPYSTPEFILQNSSMLVTAGAGTEGIPISGNFEFATTAPPPPPPPAEFHAEADAIYGTVTRIKSGESRTTTISPADEALVATGYTGTSDVPATRASQTIFSVPVYKLLTVDDSAHTDYTSTADDAIAEAKTNQGSLLNGLITWQSNDNRLACQPDTALPNRVDCSATETITGLTINKVAVHHGKFPAGTAFPVFGSIDDPACTHGAETFSGYLTTQETQLSGLGTSAITLGLTGLHLVGTATCAASTSAHSFTTQYDLAVANPSLPSYDTGAGNSAPPNTTFFVELQ